MKIKTTLLWILLLFLILNIFIILSNLTFFLSGKEVIIAKSNIRIITYNDLRNWLRTKNMPENILYDYDKSVKMLNIMLQELVLLKNAEQRLTSSLPNSSLLVNELKNSEMNNFISNVTEQNIRNYYNQNQQSFYRRPQYRLCHILVDDSDKLKTLIQSFDALVAESKNAHESMIGLTNNFSRRNPSLKRWGDLGWVSKGKFPEEFDSKAFFLKDAGDYTTFSTSLGYHFVMLMHIREPRLYPLNEVRNYIRSKLGKEGKEKFWNDFVNVLKQKYNVKTYPRNLKKAVSTEKGKAMVFIRGGEFFAGFNSMEIKERYDLWEKYVMPYVENQQKPGWINYIYKTYHKTKVKPFYIDKYEATYKEYKEFLEATGHKPLLEEIEKFIPGDDYPVVGVSWYDAEACCEWKGKRLPTQDEWEFAARGKLRRKYPWGNKLLDGERGNFADINSEVPWKNSRYDDGYKYLAPVKSYPKGATPEGIYNLGGNVKEWTATVILEEQTAITKGGSFRNSFDDMLSADQRLYTLDAVDYTVGFRCACGEDQ